MPANNVIIADPVGIVNATVGSKWRQKKLMAKDMASRMKKAGYDRRAERMASCADQIATQVCIDCGQIRVSRATLCRDRLCPICSWRLAIKRYMDMYRVLRVMADTHPGAEYLLCTLTAKNCKPNELQTMCKAMSEAWNRLINRRTVKRSIIGWAKALEVTRNKADHSLHPHYHIIVACPAGVLVEQMRTMLCDGWREVCSLTTNEAAQDIRRIEGRITANDLHLQDKAALKGLLEVFKYTQKSSDLMEMPVKELRSYAAQTSHIRMVGYGGEFKTIRAQLRMTDELEEEAATDVCIECGSINLTQLLYRWSEAAANYISL